MNVPTMAEMMSQGKKPEVLFWVGAAGSYDDRAKKITRAFVKLLHKANVDFAVLGTEESSTGDAAKRAGNEFLFQMQAISNIEILNSYEVKTIVCTDPHSFNTLKNEYPELGGNYEVYHHTQYIKKLVEEGRLEIKKSLKGKQVTYHDPCYLGRGNGVYESPRDIIRKLGVQLKEMKQHKNRALCCGAGGAQMFKDAEKGDKEINILRTEQALETNAKIIATGCPYCNTMMTDGVKFHEKESQIIVKDIAELIKAARLRTLPLSISGIILGGFLAMSDGLFNGVIFSLAILTTIGFQVISNFANDYGDGVKGTDAIRIGEERMVSSGKISPKQMKKAILISVILTIIFALFLIYESFGLSNFGYSLLFFVLGIVSIVAAIKYTVGDLAYGYSGFGDVFVFLFFGLLSVLGSYFLFTKEIYFLLTLPAISIGLLSTAVLNLNIITAYYCSRLLVP